MLNPTFPTLPLGTLTANLLGGFIIGIVTSVADSLGFPPPVRLLVTTGLLGGPTTFSTFSAETMALLMRAQYAWAAGAATLHWVARFCMTGLRVLLARLMLCD